LCGGWALFILQAAIDLALGLAWLTNLSGAFSASG
jgi:hypothetical protein